MPVGLILTEGNSQPTPPSGRVWEMSYTANVGRDRLNPGISIPSLPSANGLL